MMAMALFAALLLASPQDSSSTATSLSQQPPRSSQAAAPARPNWTPEQLEQIKEKAEQMRKSRESMRQRAIYINELAGRIHSEADARVFVDAVAEELSGQRHLFWTALSIRHRVAHAEWQAVSDPSGLIPEQRIVDVWNEYVREIDAPEEALVTVAELHNLRDSMYVGADHFAWKHDYSQSLWTMPNIYALRPDGKVANGCRALETLKIIHDMHDLFVNVRRARERMQNGVIASDVVAQKEKNPGQGSSFKARAQLLSGPDAEMYANPIRPAVVRYQQEHGMYAYDQMLRRLFEELFPQN